MSAYSFVEVRKWIADVASDYDLRLSGRRVKSVAVQWIIESELALDGVADEVRLHTDPTGDEATRRLLTLLYAAA